MEHHNDVFYCAIFSQYPDNIHSILPTIIAAESGGRGARGHTAAPSAAAIRTTPVHPGMCSYYMCLCIRVCFHCCVVDGK